MFLGSTYFLFFAYQAYLPEQVLENESPSANWTSGLSMKRLPHEPINCCKKSFGVAAFLSDLKLQKQEVFFDYSRLLLRLLLSKHLWKI